MTRFGKLIDRSLKSLAANAIGEAAPMRASLRPNCRGPTWETPPLA
jgi:hypothetical protein